MKLNLLVLIFGIVLFSGCNTATKNEASEKDKVSVDSIQIITKSFPNSPKVIEYEIPVLRGTIKKHGIQKRYYLLGSLYSRIPYVNGKREGTAFTYYPAAKGVKPVVWKEQPYINNVLHGICKRYHKNGMLQSEYEYKNGNPGIGMKEFSQSGKPKKQPYLILTKYKVATGYYITAQLSNNFEKVAFFMGKLDKGKYLPKGLKELQVKRGLGEIVVKSSTTSITITAVYATRYGNKCLISKTINL
ncbi:MAG: hypothetical protein HQ522_05630 [Bacteroidetes bacterium]|nr:hypothetical protein [Bacteroidota bacterium]